MTLTTYLCIGCPLGCRLEVQEEAGSIVEIRGFSCKRGKEYAEQEHTDPRRMVTTTVRVLNGLWPRLPVKTAEPVAKDDVQAVCAYLRSVTVRAPINVGDVIVKDVLQSGIDIVACRNMPIDTINDDFFHWGTESEGVP